MTLVKSSDKRQHVHILVVTPMFPSKERPSYGLFIKEQIEEYVNNFPNVDVKVLDLGTGNAISKYALGTLRVLFYLIKSRSDIIHLHYGLSGLILITIWPVLKALKIRTVITLHGSDALGKSVFVRFITKFASRIADCTIVVSHAIGEVIRSFLGTDNNVYYLPCGVSSSKFRCASSTRDRHAFEILFPSSPNRPEKNYARFVEIFDIVKGKIAKNNIRVVLLENVLPAMAPGVIAGADCMLLTSLHEGSPQVVKEAVFCGTPVVSVPVGEVEEILKGVEYCIVSDNNEELATACVEALLNQEEARRRVYATGHVMREKYNNKYIVLQLDRIYQSLLKE